MTGEYYGPVRCYSRRPPSRGSGPLWLRRGQTAHIAPVLSGCHRTPSASRGYEPASFRQRASGKHLRWTMLGPASSYSCLLIHICWKVEREARMEPPIQTEYLRSGGAMICKGGGI
ncbi:hypothetical protein EYF80_029334 [Liparis tanakae]|uniref:Uncharacterized protein n=1 Tax=Liparis tanakae TaxID=230148 RepID=A0A4Z2H606_9TELE|nr:hypothetical protein EYF80_029334 [Liparis tanakae]